MDNQLRREIGAPDVRYLLVVQAPTARQRSLRSERVAARLEPLVAQGTIGGFDAPGFWLPRPRHAACAPGSAPGCDDPRSQPGPGDRGHARSARIYLLRSWPTSRLHAASRCCRRGDLNGTSLALRVDSLLVEAGDGWLAMLPLRGVPAHRPWQQRRWRASARTSSFLDLKAESDLLLDTYLHEALTLSLAGSLVIVVLLSVGLRSPRRTAAVLLPLAAAVICTAGLLLTATGRLSIFNLFGLLLVAAVGSNYCLFFERTSPDARDPAGTRMIASLVLADVCTVIGFGILSFSAIPVLHGIGLTVAIGACLSLLFGAILSAHRASPVGLRTGRTVNGRRDCDAETQLAGFAACLGLAGGDCGDQPHRVHARLL